MGLPVQVHTRTAEKKTTQKATTKKTATEVEAPVEVAAEDTIEDTTEAEAAPTLVPRARPAARKRIRVPVAPTPTVFSPEERARRIAEAAYYRAEARGFVPGGEEGDWIAAEAEVDAQLSAHA